MTIDKSLVVAKTDLKMVMRVRWAKYSILLLNGIGPITVMLLLGGTMLSIPTSDPSYVPVISMLSTLSANMITLIAVIPSTLIAANSLVGEREMRTLEPLLCTPLTDQELLLGKTLSALIPSVSFLFGWTLITSLVVNMIAVVAGKPFVAFPDLPGLFLIFVAGPVVVALVVSTMIIVSGRVKRVYEAYQTGGMAALILLIPLFVPMMFIQDETSLIDPSIIWLTNIATFLIAVVLAAVTWSIALKTFNRDSMISRRG